MTVIGIFKMVTVYNIVKISTARKKATKVMQDVCTGNHKIVERNF